MENYLGEHILAELKGCNRDILNNIDVVEEIMLNAVRIAKATIIEKCFHKFSPYGVSGVVVIAESHLALHTWPEHNYAAIDFFTCSKQCDTKAAIEYLTESFECKEMTMQTIKRGEFYCCREECKR